MKRAACLLLVAGCGGAPTPVPVPVAGAPAWAGPGTSTTNDGHRFVCQGQAATELDAVAAARGICEDQICKLCGVEVESVLETREDLTGIELQRKVVERCRRVRREELAPSRKSVECGPDGCIAWIELHYSDSLRERECSAMASESFADPAECQRAIEAFRNIQGSTAASVRERANLLEQARTACAEIDVRPTPLMGSLEERLRDGMASLRRSGPRYLSGYWLADYPPMWKQYAESPSFTERIDLLLSYLRHKIPILDVLEAATVPDTELDTKEGLAKLLETMKRAPVQSAYGTQGVHFAALESVEALARSHRLTTDVATLNAWMRGAYPPATVTEWRPVVLMTGLFAADGTIDATEWEWTMGLTRWRREGLRTLLQTPSHRPNDRVARFHEALARELQGVKPDTHHAVLEQLMPRDQPQLMLAVEPDLPELIRKQLDWDDLAEHLPDHDDDVPDDVRTRHLARMHRFLATVPANPISSGFCTGLYRHLETLEEHGGTTRGLGATLCACLEGPMARDGTRVSVNKSSLYSRALREEAPCVQPLP